MRGCDSSVAASQRPQAQGGESMGHEKGCQIEPGELQASGHLLRKEMPQEWPELVGRHLESVTL